MNSVLSSKPAKDIVVQQLLKPFLVHLDREGVTEVWANKPGELWSRTFGSKERHEVPELTWGYMQSFAVALATYNGLPVKSVMSIVFPEGQRGQIVMPPACIDGMFALLIRKHAMVVKSLEQLEAEGCFESFVDVSFNKPTDVEAAAMTERRDFTRLEPFEVELLRLKREGRVREFLEQCVLTKRNLVIAGKTGSGKTTFARSLIEKVPSYERLLTIQDVHELFLNHSDHFHLMYGPGTGRVSADECLAACMRLSPDRIFLSELRGNEAWEYVNSLNTGHPGSITTTHSNNALETYQRITTLIKKSEVGRLIDVDTIKTELYRTLDVVLYFKDRQLIEVFYDPIFSKSKIA